MLNTFINYAYMDNQQVAAAITHRAIFNTTMAISGLVGPQEEISFYGHPIAYLAPWVYGHPHVSHPILIRIVSLTSV